MLKILIKLQIYIECYLVYLCSKFCPKNILDSYVLYINTNKLKEITTHACIEHESFNMWNGFHPSVMLKVNGFHPKNKFLNDFITINTFRYFLY